MRFTAAKFILVCVTLSVIGLVFPSQSSAEIDPETCVGAWLFEEGSGKKAIDSSGNGNDGDIQGSPGWVNGKFGSAMDFDGKADHIIIPDADSLDLDHLTIAAWIYIRSYPEDARIITKEIDGAPYSAYTLCLSGGGYKKLEFRPVLNNTRFRIPSNPDIPLNQWTHVAATFDGQNCVLYINGEIDKEEPHTGIMLVSDTPVYIGASEFWDPRFFDGLMDDAVLFNVSLAQDDVKKLMEIGMPNILAVSAAGKLATTWAQVKRMHP